MTCYHSQSLVHSRVFWLLMGVFLAVTVNAAPGVLTIQTDAVLQETAFLEIELAGTTPGTEFDQLNVEGDLSVDGELRIVLSDNYFPDPQDIFVVISAQTLSGTFTNEEMGRVPLADGSGSMRITYDSTSVTLSDFVSLALLFRDGFENE
ncbi:MAG: hypothetical protein QNJ40_26970 [Xanthomonadales bacterium]|nr:hypothetical protein [Xanthomonadales bacterium]